MFSLICAWITGWVNNGEAGDMRRHRADCDAIVMIHMYTTLEIYAHCLRIALLCGILVFQVQGLD